MKLIIVRHTEVGVEPGICYGCSDVPLADTFEEEAATVLAKLERYSRSWTKIYSSPLTRCRRLAHKLDPNSHISRDLIEYDFGSWELTPWRDIKDGQAWFDDFINTPAPGGEAFTDLYQRVERFWENELLPMANAWYAQPKKERGRRPYVAVFTHAGVVRAFLGLVLSMPLEKTFDVSIDKGGLVEMTLRSHNVQVEKVNG